MVGYGRDRAGFLKQNNLLEVGIIQRNSSLALDIIKVSFSKPLAIVFKHPQNPIVSREAGRSPTFATTAYTI